MFALNKQHRECLLNDLQKAKDDLELQELCLRERKDDHLVGWNEMGIFLAQERVKLIEKSLVDNEIDY